jgi:hypothetical protein
MQRVFLDHIYDLIKEYDKGSPGDMFSLWHGRPPRQELLPSRRAYLLRLGFRGECLDVLPSSEVTLLQRKKQC